MRSDELIVYRDITKDPVFHSVTSLIEKSGPLLQQDNYDAQEIRRGLKEEADQCVAMLVEKAGQYGFTGNLWRDWLCNLLVNDVNTFSRQAEVRGNVTGSINEAVEYDFKVLQYYYDFDFTRLIQELDAPELSLIQSYEGDNTNAEIYNSYIRDQICALAQEKQMKQAVTAFYQKFGVGTLGLHKAFRLDVDHSGDPHIVPIHKIAPVVFTDLVGYERQKKKLIDNTEAFVAGRPCNNVLLYGEAGTGKSSSIKALANEYYEKGLRVIEVYRHQFQYLNDVIGMIKNRNYRFIIYMDDLSFEEFETEYKYLKAVIEGGLEKKPDNVLIYATSNRRHLIRESFHDRDGVDIADKHGGDTVQEKLSLSGRFGVSIYYGAPSFQEFHEIVEELARRNGIVMDKEQLDKEATAWEMRHGGLSGRCAQQFIDYLRGTECVQE